VAEIINLRQARKRKAREDKERVAAANRVVHGRPKAEKIRDALSADKAERFVEGHRRERPKDDPA